MNRATRAGLSDFQKREGLPVDGIAGPETEKALVDAKGRQFGNGSNLSRSSELEDFQYLHSGDVKKNSDQLDFALEHEGPSVASNCGGQKVLSALHLAMQYASLASQRLNYLSSLTASVQKERWNAGPENTWFGAYNRKRLVNVRNRMWKIVKTLKNPLLVISCNWQKPWLGFASPGIPEITLGGGWRDLPNDHVKKTQTFIHEAAHIRHAVLGGDNIKKYYGVKAAKRRAYRRPGIAIRTAENIGYYAVCRASKTHGCP
jgi:hypothetical protein